MKGAGIRIAQDSELRGRMNADKTTAATDAHYENPGPTPNIRGIEPNTNPSNGEPCPPQHGSADEHGSMVDTPDHSVGIPYRTYPLTTSGREPNGRDS